MKRCDKCKDRKEGCCKDCGWYLIYKHMKQKIDKKNNDLSGKHGREVCGNCFHSIPTDIDGLVDCQCDGCMKDDDMPCNIDNFEFK